MDGALKQRIRELGERLDAHRKRQQALHPDLTLTGIYNVLEKVRRIVVPPSGGSESLRTVVPPLGGALESPEPPKGGTTMPSLEPLTAKEREIHDQGLVSVLKQIHDDLDAAVLEAYGWRKEAGSEFQVSGSKSQVSSEKPAAAGGRRT